MDNQGDSYADQGRDDLDRILTERHLRIKSQRRAFLSTVIGLSGGAIVLSASLLEKLAPKKAALWLVIGSWGFLALSLLSAMFVLLRMIAHSVQYQRFLEGKTKQEGLIA